MGSAHFLVAAVDRIERVFTGYREAQDALAGLRPFHFPIAFPEVFLRPRAGFDVMLGNPPWEKVRVEEHEFWSRHALGLRGLGKAQRDQLMGMMRKTRPDLVALWEQERTDTEKMRDAVRELPGMDTGHPDLFRAFTWRFIQLACSIDGRIGVVLPGDAFKIAGGADVRERLVAACSSITPQMVTNKAGWVFDDVHPQKLISFLTLSVSKTGGNCVFNLTPEFHGQATWARRAKKDSVNVPLGTMRSYCPSLVVPLLPRTKSFEVIQALMRYPVIISNPVFRVRRVYADFETSKHDKQYWHDNEAQGDWPVYTGESFDIWQPDTGSYYAWANAKAILQAAHVKWSRAPRGSPYADLPKAWRQKVQNHPVHFPRIAFRDVTNRTNTRTLVVALIPAHVITVQTSPWVLWLDPEHPKDQEAYLLGVMSSLSLDWWCRRFIEGHADQESFNCLRIPDPQRQPELAGRVVALAGAKAYLARVPDGGIVVGSSNLTYGGLRRNLELNLGHYNDPQVSQVQAWFEELWETAEPFDLAAFYDPLMAEFSPYLIYLRVLYALYGEELAEEQRETGDIPLTDFQRHGVWRALRILKRCGGVLVADGVGLGKTFLAGDIIRLYKARRQRVLLICPAALRDSTWRDFLDRFDIKVDCVSYEQLANDRQLGGQEPHLRNSLEDYALVVIDEAHAYRNPESHARAGALRRLLLGHVATSLCCLPRRSIIRSGTSITCCAISLSRTPF
jgi:hypothetical protein